MLIFQGMSFLTGIKQKLPKKVQNLKIFPMSSIGGFQGGGGGGQPWYGMGDSWAK